MSEEIPTPETIWIITGETYIEETLSGSRSSYDTGGRLGEERRIEEHITKQPEPVKVDKLKQEMRGFLKAMREILNEADPPDAKMQLNEVELSVEINGEGQISLFGSGGKVGGKGAMTFKFKRRNG